MMSDKMSCYIGMTLRADTGKTASIEVNVTWRRLFSYYYIHMIQRGDLGRFFGRFKYRSLKKMKEEDEKYRIKPRKKFAKQIWIRDGKAVLVEPIEEKKEGV